MLLWLLTTPAAHAASKVTICHKHGAANQKILTIGEAGLEDHLAHGDHVVGQEVCDGVDNDCDRVVDDDPTDLGECTAGVGECAVEDGEFCDAGAVVCLAEASGPPEASEFTCNDGIANECAGLCKPARRTPFAITISSHTLPSEDRPPPTHTKPREMSASPPEPPVSSTN